MALTLAQRESINLVNRVVAGEPDLAGIFAEATLLLSQSHNGVRMKVFGALRKELGLDDWEKFWEADLSLRDVYDKDVVYHYKEKDWRRPYVIEDDKVTFSPAVQTNLSYVDQGEESVNEAGMITESLCLGGVKITEAAKGEGLIRIIGPGQGTSGYYPKDVLKRDGPKIFLEGTHMYWNHPTEDQARARPEDDLNEQAGVLTSTATWDESGPLGEGVYAKYKALSEYKDRIKERADYGLVQISWRGWGTREQKQVAGKVTEVFNSLTRVKSVDFVTRAGAKGAIAVVSESKVADHQRRGMAQVNIEDTELAALRTEAALAAGFKDQNAKLRSQINTSMAMVAIEEKLRPLNFTKEAHKRTSDLFLMNVPVKENGEVDLEKLAANLDEYVKSFGGPVAVKASAGNGVVNVQGQSPSNTTVPTREQEVAQTMRLGFSKESAELMYDRRGY